MPLHDRLAIKNSLCKRKKEITFLVLLKWSMAFQQPPLWPIFFDNMHVTSKYYYCLLTKLPGSYNLNKLFVSESFCFYIIEWDHLPVSHTCECLVYGVLQCKWEDRHVFCGADEGTEPLTFWCSWTSSQKSLLLLILSCTSISTCKVLPSISFLLNYCVLKKVLVC
jgi:hypothetical protein